MKQKLFLLAVFYVIFIMKIPFEGKNFVPLATIEGSDSEFDNLTTSDEAESDSEMVPLLRSSVTQRTVTEHAATTQELEIIQRRIILEHYLPFFNE